MKDALFMEVAPGGRLVATDPYTQEIILTKLKQGKSYKVTVVEDRTSDKRRGQHRFFFGGLGLLLENLPEADAKRWRSLDSLRAMLMEALGYTHRTYFLDHKSADGVGWRNEVDSIAFANMSDEDFDRLVEQMRGIAIGRWGFDPWTEWSATHGYDP